MDLEYTQHINLTLLPSEEFGKQSILTFKKFLMEETLTEDIKFEEPKEGFLKEWEFDDYKIKIGITTS